MGLTLHYALLLFRIPPANLLVMRKKSIYQYTVFVESCEEGGYFANCPSLPGCHVQGETLEKTLKEMESAIGAYLEDVRDQGETIPKPSQVAIASIGVSV